MKELMKWLKDEESGQGLVEYALIIGLVSLVVIIAVGIFGDNLNAWWEELGDTVATSL